MRSGLALAITLAIFAMVPSACAAPVLAFNKPAAGGKRRSYPRQGASSRPWDGRLHTAGPPRERVSPCRSCIRLPRAVPLRPRHDRLETIGRNYRPVVQAPGTRRPRTRRSSRSRSRSTVVRVRPHAPRRPRRLPRERCPQTPVRFRLACQHAGLDDVRGRRSTTAPVRPRRRLSVNKCPGVVQHAQAGHQDRGRLRETVSPAAGLRRADCVQASPRRSRRERFSGPRRRFKNPNMMLPIF